MKIVQEWSFRAPVQTIVMETAIAVMECAFATLDSLAEIAQENSDQPRVVS